MLIRVETDFDIFTKGAFYITRLTDILASNPDKYTVIGHLPYRKNCFPGVYTITEFKSLADKYLKFHRESVVFHEAIKDKIDLYLKGV